ncbi:MAG TPA: hypothetical protein DCQ06_12380 [Myxococcales bacterium]|nr:hypothetical protein [Myxococcales bacterium]
MTATLTSLDLRTCLHIAVQGYAQQTVDQSRDSVTEMNFLRIDVRLQDEGRELTSVHCRALRSELLEMAEALAFCGEAQQSHWSGRMLDCPLVVRVNRPQDLGMNWSVCAILVEGGVLPPGVELVWAEERLEDPSGMMTGVRFETRPEALALFARSLEGTIDKYPHRKRIRIT